MLTALFVSILLNLIFAGVVLYFKETIKAVVDYRKKKALADYQMDLDELAERRRKAQLVAELFSRRFNKPDEVYEFEKLNWELALVLPKDLVCLITTKLVEKNDKFSAMEVLVAIRERLGVKDGLEPQNIAYKK
ncbi:MAG: hypothetical protein HYV96_15825 [Opitutae bacterium]|nr:hypothetical protein [Opitutae bacterium]